MIFFSLTGKILSSSHVLFNGEFAMMATDFLMAKENVMPGLYWECYLAHESCTDFTI